MGRLGGFGEKSKRFGKTVTLEPDSVFDVIPTGAPLILQFQHKEKLKTAYQVGREAYEVIDPRKCPFFDEARRAAWQQGYEDAKKDFPID